MIETFPAVEGPKCEVERPIRSCLSWSELRTIPFEKQALILFLSGIPQEFKDMPGKPLYCQGGNQCEKTLVIQSDNRKRYGRTFREGEALLILGGGDASIEGLVWSIHFFGRKRR